jgi:uncharacterized membrane protein YdjX (TVP38/TMEM64 family)
VKKYIPVAVMGCMVVAAVVFVLLNGNITVDMLLHYTPRNKLLAALVIVALYALKSQTVIILYGVIAAAAGILFELPVALAVNTVGSVVCISVPYFLGRASDGVLVEGILSRNARLRDAYEANRENTFLAAFVLRVLNLSNDLLGLFFGSLKAPYFEYLASSFLGILPAMVMYTVLGSDLDFTSPAVLACAGVDVACILAAWLFLRRKKRRLIKEKRNS